MKLERHAFTLVDLMIVMAVLVVLAWALFPRTTGCKAKATRIQCTNNLKQVGLAFRIWATDHEGAYPMQVSTTNRGAMESLLAGNVAAVFQLMSNELVAPKILFCPTEKQRIQANIFTQSNATQPPRGSVLFAGNTNITYFVGLDAVESLPSAFLSGDDNFLLGQGSDARGDVVDGKPVGSGILSLATNSPIAWSEKRHEKQGNVGLADGSVQGFSNRALQQALAHTGLATNRLALP